MATSTPPSSKEMALQSTKQQVDIATLMTPDFLKRRKDVGKDIVRLKKEISDHKLYLEEADSRIRMAKRNGDYNAALQWTQTQQEKLKMLPKTISALQERQRTLDSMQYTIDSTILEYGRTSSLALTSYMYDTLPCELRDAVYQYLFADFVDSFFVKELYYEEVAPKRGIVFRGKSLSGRRARVVRLEGMSEQVFGEFIEAWDFFKVKEQAKEDKKWEGYLSTLDSSSADDSDLDFW